LACPAPKLALLSFLARLSTLLVGILSVLVLLLAVLNLLLVLIIHATIFLKYDAAIFSTWELIPSITSPDHASRGAFLRAALAGTHRRSVLWEPFGANS
jgi:hypothetical protein